MKAIHSTISVLLVLSCLFVVPAIANNNFRVWYFDSNHNEYKEGSINYEFDLLLFEMLDGEQFIIDLITRISGNVFMMFFADPAIRSIRFVLLDCKCPKCT